MATPTKRHINWTVSWTPSAGVEAPITGVQSVEIAHNPEVTTHSGDADAYATGKFVTFRDPRMTIRFRDFSMYATVEDGDFGVIEATHLDARNGATAASGGYTVTLDLAICTDKSWSGQHRQLGEGTLVFETESADGATPSIEYAAL